MASCEKQGDSCIEEKLLSYEMVAYTGQDIGCKMFLHEYEMNGSYYYLLDNYCADMVTFFEDCEGNNYHSLNNSTYLGIVGISE